MMAQPDLFGFSPPPSEQDVELARVAGKIGQSVMTFLEQRRPGGTFHAKDLHEFVGPGVAPASADRILRLMRQNGAVNYEIVNRRASLYRILELHGACNG
jgi:hypothetical protein